MNNDYSSLTPEEKKLDLFLRQKRTLDLFLERNAISKAQYDKSLGDLIKKMGNGARAARDWRSVSSAAQKTFDLRNDMI